MIAQKSFRNLGIPLNIRISNIPIRGPTALVDLHRDIGEMLSGSSLVVRGRIARDVWSIEEMIVVQAALKKVQEKFGLSGYDSGLIIFRGYFDVLAVQPADRRRPQLMDPKSLQRLMHTEFGIVGSQCIVYVRTMSNGVELICITGRSHGIASEEVGRWRNGVHKRACGLRWAFGVLTGESN
ncbi:hypothetical protein CIHG_08491 [Coccidioides immitis H538.4]|uniref:Uncharacterized protein n=1 Tax=Coccidioides immitis H538.4 TaxID=396776 RepID=A0A0J8RZT7_COCIT|nr:hypothetical protein CIHG_08491 [Coccidioides immitis H538.4]